MSKILAHGLSLKGKKKAVLVSISKRILALEATVLDILLHLSIKHCAYGISPI